MRAMLDDPATGALTIQLPAQGTRHVRLREKAADPVGRLASLSWPGSAASPDPGFLIPEI